MSPLPSIRSRLSRVVLTVSLAWSLAVFNVVWLAVHHELDIVLDGTMQESAEILYGLLKVNADQLPRSPGTGGMAMPAPPHRERMVWQMVSREGRVLLRSHTAPDHPLSTVPQGHSLEVTEGWHVFSLPFDDKGTVLLVAQSHGERRRAQLQAALVTACGALTVGLACAWWLRRRVARELDPLIMLSSQVAAYHPLEPQSSLAQATREELKPVRDAIVNLGERLSHNIVSERAFSANAAHALRTPLAGLGAQLALAQRESPPPAQARLQRARQAADRLSRVVTALLSLFRSGGELHRRTIAIAPFVKDLPVEGLDICIDDGEGLSVAVDPDLLAAALLNLLDNSVRYGATQVRCSFAQDKAGRRTQIRLTDNGPGIDDATRTRIALALASQRYEQEMGLGLMLADRVARAHGGQLTLLRCESGFGVELSLASP